ncbi:unnamed protein product [Closterium sp. Naga37s-1]|nr:unnamed protein product [Closterium sp. Naga37s-1]
MAAAIASSCQPDTPIKGRKASTTPSASAAELAQWITDLVTEQQQQQQQQGKQRQASKQHQQTKQQEQAVGGNASLRLCIVVHNLDAPPLRASPACITLLSLLAACPAIAVIASVDHVLSSACELVACGVWAAVAENMPVRGCACGPQSGRTPSENVACLRLPAHSPCHLPCNRCHRLCRPLFDRQTLSLFNFATHHVVTRGAYTKEASAFSPATLSHTPSASAAAQAALLVLRSLPPNACQIFSLIAQPFLPSAAGGSKGRGSAGGSAGGGSGGGGGDGDGEEEGGGTGQRNQPQGALSPCSSFLPAPPFSLLLLSPCSSFLPAPLFPCSSFFPAPAFSLLLLSPCSSFLPAPPFSLLLLSTCLSLLPAPPFSLLFRLSCPTSLPFAQLYSLSRTRFLVTSEVTLRAHLREFEDHALVRVFRQADGTESVGLLLPVGALTHVMEQLGGK